MGTPKKIFFLTADAFWCYAANRKTNKRSALYYFLAGYTSKLAGTEVGLGKEPQATFSMCFGSPFMPLAPGVYADLLGKKIEQHKVDVWLINTGWTGGPYGVGHRFELPYTRAMVAAALNGDLTHLPLRKEPFFNLWIPESCPGVPSEFLDPQITWSDKDAYQHQAQDLIERFEKNFEKFKGVVSKEIFLAGPGNKS